MGMFNSFAAYSGLDESGNFFNETELEEAMQELEEVEDVEVNDDLMEACVQAAIANEQNLNMVIMSVANEEMNYFVENGVEMVYEEGKISAFFGKIKSALKKAWEKIKSIFNKALDHIRSWISSDKKFVQKYGEEIKKYADKVKISGYKVDGKAAATATPYKTIQTATSEYINNFAGGGDKKLGTDFTSEKLAGMVRGRLTGANTASVDDVVSKLKGDFGVKEKSTDFTYPGEEVYNELAKGKSTQNVVKAGYNSAKAAIAGLQASVKQAETIAKNKNTEGGSYGTCLSLCSCAISLLNACQRTQVHAVGTYHTNCRKIAAKCVSKSKEAKSSSNESFGFDDFDALLV